jgi:hypothetical protein
VLSNRTTPSESKYLNTRTSSKTTAAVVAMEMGITWTDLTVSLVLSSESYAILELNLIITFCQHLCSNLPVQVLLSICLLISYNSLH